MNLKSTSTTLGQERQSNCITCCCVKTVKTNLALIKNGFHHRLSLVGMKRRRLDPSAGITMGLRRGRGLQLRRGRLRQQLLPLIYFPLLGQNPGNAVEHHRLDATMADRLRIRHRNANPATCMWLHRVCHRALHWTLTVGAVSPIVALSLRDDPIHRAGSHQFLLLQLRPKLCACPHDCPNVVARLSFRSLCSFMIVIGYDVVLTCYYLYRVLCEAFRSGTTSVW